MSKKKTLEKLHSHNKNRLKSEKIVMILTI
jgi:hypothetical protein